MRVLNLFSGLGGNRRLWEGVEVTAVEYEADIAAFYQDHYPQDTVIVGDAYEYLLEHWEDFDFIWASVPCPSHSRARYWSSKGGAYTPVYPDFRLYEVIAFLKHFAPCPWAVENVKPYYDQPALYQANYTMGRHMFWCNFPIQAFSPKDSDIKDGKREEWQQDHQIDLAGYKFKDRTDKLLRNCVSGELGLHILECSRTESPETIEQMGLSL